MQKASSQSSGCEHITSVASLEDPFFQPMMACVNFAHADKVQLYNNVKRDYSEDLLKVLTVPSLYLAQ